MSYAFRVEKTEGTLRLMGDEELLKQIAAHIPDGAVFTINGHEPGPGTSTVGMIGVHLAVQADEAAPVFRGSALGQYDAVREGN